MNLQMMMKQAQKMQADMEKNKSELAKLSFTVEKQGVTVVIGGDKIVKSIDINEAIIDPEDKDILEDLMVIAMNEAYAQVEDAEEEMMPQAPGGMPF